MSASKIQEFIEETENKEILRFVTIGSVDDGKSTLIGRLLHDTNAVYDDQLQAVESASVQNVTEGEIDFALITDGLKAEREQGITIDVAYRYFSTKKRKFIIADTPGHVQYTRNMATGASTADVALILIDARHGVLPQTRRHAYISSLLGIHSLLVCVNKMDLMDYDETVFQNIKKSMLEASENFLFHDIQFIPVSALKGSNIVTSSENTPWYKGPSVLEYLETVVIPRDEAVSHFALPVANVLRPNLNFRGFTGRVISGAVQIGDEILALPSGKKSAVKDIILHTEELKEAYSGMSVLLTLEDEIDISRGDILVHPEHTFKITHKVKADLVWLDEEPMKTGKQYYIKHNTNSAISIVNRIETVLNVETLEKEPTDSKTLQLNDIAEVILTVNRPLIADLYRNNRQAGAFILIDRLTNQTCGAGMISVIYDEDSDEEFTERLSARDKSERFAQVPGTIRIYANEFSKAEEVAIHLERKLFERGHFAVYLSPESYSENLASAFLEQGLLVISANESAEEKITLQLGKDVQEIAKVPRITELLNFLSSSGALR